MKAFSRTKISVFNSVSVCYFQFERFLLVKKEPLFVDYLKIPSSITKICLQNKELISWGVNNCESLNFLNSLAILKNSCRLKKKKIFLKGLGFKINYFLDIETLNFKLGYSHLISLPILKGVNMVKIGKNFVIISSFDMSLLGNFINKIQHLRFPDSYKGKGFWKKYEKRPLKLFKKK